MLYYIIITVMIHTQIPRYISLSIYLSIGLLVIVNVNTVTTRSSSSSSSSTNVCLIVAGIIISGSGGRG